MYDRDGKWSTSTCLMCMFLGFTIGFLTCHKLYIGIEKNHLTIPSTSVYTP